MDTLHIPRSINIDDLPSISSFVEENGGDTLHIPRSINIDDLPSNLLSLERMGTPYVPLSFNIQH